MRSVFLHSILLALALGLGPARSAERLGDVVWQAPATRSARQRAAAAAARVDAEGRLPDPELEAMVSRVDMPDGENPMWGVGLRQNLLKRGERGAGKQRAEAVAAMRSAEALAMAADLAADTTMFINEAAAATSRAEILEAQASRLELALSTLDARIASGGGGFAERLTLQSALASMRLMAERERRRSADALAEARARLGLADDARLPPLEFPDPESIAPENAPAYLLADAGVREARAMDQMARAMGRPMRAVSLRFEREEEDMGNTDVVGFAFMTGIPFRSRRNAKAEARAARAEADAAGSDIETLRHRIDADRSRWHRADAFAVEARRIATETNERLQGESTALLRAAGVEGAFSILLLVELLERQAQNEIQAITAEAEARAALAALWRYVPPDPPNPSGDLP